MNADTPIFDVICEARINGRLVRYQRETPVDPPLTLTEVMNDIVGDQYGRVLHVWEKNIEEGTAINISEYVAMMIRSGLRKAPSDDLRGFLEDHLGVLTEAAE
jgi:hypothetical protein